MIKTKTNRDGWTFSCCAIPNDANSANETRCKWTFSFFPFKFFLFFFCVDARVFFLMNMSKLDIAFALIVDFNTF